MSLSASTLTGHMTTYILSAIMPLIIDVII